MYKLLLCLRYLRTRYIALASLISVMLGVATMIIVNAVMAGFTGEMQDRLHGILSDIVFESRSLNGFYDPDWHMEQIRRIAGDDIEAMTATVHVPAMLSYRYGDSFVTHPVQLIGVPEDAKDYASEFTRYLQHPENRQRMSFELRDGGYDTVDQEAEGVAVERRQLAGAGWKHRRLLAAHEETRERIDTVEDVEGPVADPFAAHQPQGETFDPASEQHVGAVLGIALSSYRMPDGREHFLVLPGDDIKLTFPTAGSPPEAISDAFTVVDLYESKMSEYDSQLVFVPLRQLQRDRGMIDPQSGIGYVTAIQIKLKPEAELNGVRDKLRASFRPELYGVYSWRDKQGPLLAAVEMETAILNVLLFLIIAVAGFGILAIFFMIVVEKTRDIGILKSLGASNRGAMSIFLSYGLSLGVVGSGVGMVLGLLFVAYINPIADLVGRLTGHRVFDPSIYYFYKIPTQVNPFTVCWIVVGAVTIAILASILPARRAALLNPVEALRYE